MPRFAYVDGSYVPHAKACVHVEDRGFQFADAVYEVIAIRRGVLLDERGHLDRLVRSLNELKIPLPMSVASLRIVMRELVRRNRVRDASLYLQITRGEAARDFRFSLDMAPTLVMTVRRADFSHTKQLSQGLKVMSVRDIRWARPDIKTVMLLPSSLAKMHAIEQGADDAWLVDANGYVTEGSSNNAWIVTGDGEIVTRPADGKILKGVTRSALQHVAELFQLRIVERNFTIEEAQAACEAFSTSASAFVAPIVSIDGKQIGDGKPGRVALGLRERYLAYSDGAHGEQIGWTPA
jgi:D-alanine transaminase